MGKSILTNVIAALVLAVLAMLIVTIVQRPEAHLSIIPENGKVLSGENVKISWKTENADDVWLEGTAAERIKVKSNDSQYVIVKQPTTFRIVASNSWLKALFLIPEKFCSAIDTGTVEILERPSVTFWAEPAEVTAGEDVTLKWSATNADHVFIKGIQSGPLVVERVNGSRQVKIDNTKTFEIVVSNRAGKTSEPLTVRATIPEPKASISLDREEVLIGDTVTVTWHCENADSVVLKGIDADDIDVEPSGSRRLTIHEPKTIEVLASNKAGRVMKSVTVNVDSELEVSISVHPSSVVKGEYATITWNSKNAQTVTLSGFGEVPIQGSRQVQILSSGTYEVVATSPTGSRRAAATLNVRLPTAALIARGHIGGHLKQAIYPLMDSFFRAKGHELVSYNSPEETALINAKGVDYLVPYELNLEWKSSQIKTPSVSIGQIKVPSTSYDQHTVEVHITIYLTRLSDGRSFSSYGQGKASIKAARTPYVEFSGSPTSIGKEIEATQKAVAKALNGLKQM